MLVDWTKSLVHSAQRDILLGVPSETLADAVRRAAAEEQAAKVVSFADMKRKLRPPEPGTLASALKNIGDAFNG